MNPGKGGIVTVLMIVVVPWAMLMGVPDGFAFESIRENCSVAAGAVTPRMVTGTVRVDWPDSR